tara:strand:- start:508 stop:768 length:261 start_codon:yes stop_codon:yes gene_type:complete
MKLTKTKLKDMIREELMNEGPAYEYDKYIKEINKSRNKFGSDVMKFAQFLSKRGLKKESKELLNIYGKESVINFKYKFDKFLGKLL